MAKVKAIPDPERKGSKPVEMPVSMNLKDLQIKGVGKPAAAQTPTTAKDTMPKHIHTGVLSELVLTTIDEVVPHKSYYIGKGEKRLNCGQVLKVVANGSFVSLKKSGDVAIEQTVPKNYSKDKQITIKIGSNQSKDAVIIVGANGCLLLEANSLAVLDMPVFVVEPTGDYYAAESGQRKFLLGPGIHLIAFTDKLSILYVRAISVTKSDEKTASKSTSKDSGKNVTPKPPVVAKVDSNASKTASKTASKDSTKKVDNKDANKTVPKTESKDNTKKVAAKVDNKDSNKIVPKTVSKDSTKKVAVKVDSKDVNKTVPKTIFNDTTKKVATKVDNKDANKTVPKTVSKENNSQQLTKKSSTPKLKSVSLITSRSQSSTGDNLRVQSRDGGSRGGRGASNTMIGLIYIVLAVIIALAILLFVYRRRKRQSCGKCDICHKYFK